MDIKKSFVIPSQAAKQLLSYNPTHYAISEAKNWLHFYTEDGVTFSCRTYAKKYPDVKELLKVEGVEIEIPKKIDDILERAIIFAKGKFDQDMQVRV